MVSNRISRLQLKENEFVSLKIHVYMISVKFFSFTGIINILLREIDKNSSLVICRTILIFTED